MPDVFDDSRNQAPPTNGETYDIPIPINVPYALNKDNEDEMIIDLTTNKEGATGPYRGHTTWTGKGSKALQTGSHDLHLTYQNIIMPDEMDSKIVCEDSLL